MYYRLFKLIFIQRQWLKLTQDFSDFFPGYKVPGIKTEEQNYNDPYYICLHEYIL